MIEPASLSALIGGDPLKDWQSAIISKISELLTGVTVKAHPGKIDISQMMARAIVPAPGIAVGWSRVRTARYINGAVDITADWSAYIVAEDMVLDNKRIDRDRVGFAIGHRLLRILGDPEASLWDMTSISLPADQPAPQLSPLFTVADEAKGTGYLAVTWTQSLVAQGDGLFAGLAPTLSIVTDDDGRAAIDAEFGAHVPPDVRSAWRDEP